MCLISWGTQKRSEIGFGLPMQDNQGRDVDLKCYKGKILLIINVASQWYLIWAWKKFIVPQCPLSIFYIFFFMGFIQKFF